MLAADIEEPPITLVADADYRVITLTEDGETSERLTTTVTTAPAARTGRLFLDAGHGWGNRGDGYDPGAVGLVEEHATVATIRDAVVKAVGATAVPDGLSVTKRGTWLAERSARGDALVSLHMNAASSDASGVEVLFDATRIDQARTAARLAACIASKTGLPNRGAIPDTRSHVGRVHILRAFNGTALLVELGFVGNRTDVAAVRTHGAQAVASCIQTAI